MGAKLRRAQGGFLARHPAPRPLWPGYRRLGVLQPESAHPPMSRARCGVVSAARSATFNHQGITGLLCARVDSNHHGPNGPQGPQPDPPAVDGYAGVRIVHFAGPSGRIGRIWRGDFCQSFVTGSSGDRSDEAPRSDEARRIGPVHAAARARSAHLIICSAGPWAPQAAPHSGAEARLAGSSTLPERHGTAL
jgi:hypothetical protein